MAQAVKAAVAVAVAAAVAAGGWWWQHQQASDLGYLNEIPADTLLYAGGLEAAPATLYSKQAGEMVALYRDVAVLAYHQYRNKAAQAAAEAAQQAADSGDEAAAAAAEGEGEVAAHQSEQDERRLQLLMQLLGDLLASASDYDSQVIPVNRAQPAAIYTVGMVPVVRFDADGPALASYFEQLASRNQLQFERLSEGGIDYLKLMLVEDEPSLALAVVVTPGKTRITALSAILDDEARGLVLGSREPAESLADSGVISELPGQLQLANHSLFRLSLVELARAVVEPKHSLLGRQMATLGGEDYHTALAEWQNAACVNDIVALAGQVPAVVGGVPADGLSSSEQGTQIEVRSVLQLTNPQVRKQLARIQGYVPAALSRDDGSVPWIGFGYGINTRELASASQELWTLFTSGSYQCAPLEQLRLSAAEQNPAMIAAGTAMVNGLKGVYGALYQVALAEPGAELPVKSVDALIGVAATNPRTLWNMSAAFNPLVSTLSWPADDTPVQLPMPEGWPQAFSLWLKVKGEHAIVYVGEQAAKEAEQISLEKVESNALFASAIDYASALEQLDPAELLAKAISADSGDDEWADDGSNDGQDCVMRASINQFAGMMRVKGVSRTWIGEQGIHSEQTSTIPPAKATAAPTPHQLGGDYTTYLLGNGCAEQHDGHEQLAANGASDYQATDAASGCAYYQTSGRWQRQGNVLVWDYDRERSVEEGSCTIADAPWSAGVSEPVQACRIFNEQADGFDCLFNSDPEDGFVMRYRLTAKQG